MRTLLPALLLLLPLTAWSQPAELLLDDFSKADLAGWSTSMSPDYYKGNTGQKGLQVVTDTERGSVLACDVRFVDPAKSEPCFITRELANPVPLTRLLRVSFWYKLQGPAALDPVSGFRVRLRTSPTEFNDYEVAAPPRDRWVRCSLDTKSPTSVRNIWTRLFQSVKQVTFRLDDLDADNSQFSLLLDDVRFELTEAPDAPYTPQAYALTKHEGLRVLQLRHAAAGHYQVEPVARWLDRRAQVRTFPFKGLHFGLDLYGYPASVKGLLDTDLIVMVDVDPFILTPAQARDLADLVYSGTGLVFLGGYETLAKSRDFRRPLAEVLPVTFTPGQAEAETRQVTADSAHPLGAGLRDGGPGRASQVQKLTAKPGAAVAWKAGDRPVVVTGQFGRGRVVVINAMPYLDGADDVFFQQGYPAWLGRVFAWATAREAKAGPGPQLPRPAAEAPAPATVPRKVPPFPIITMAGLGASGHYLDEADIRADLTRMRDYGFNTIAVGGLSSLARSGDKPNASDRNARTIQRLAGELGLSVLYEYSSFNALTSHGPTKPCVFSPEFPAALAAKLQPQLDVARGTPNLLSVKILDEPTASAASLDYCPYCQAEFQKRYGLALRKLEEIPAEAAYERWAFANFVGDYVAEGYRQGYEFKRRGGGQFDLLITYMSPGLGYGRPLGDQEDALKWGRYADRMDFDVYPYFYPASQRLRMVQAAYCMAYQRQLARHLGKPWGFYFELDDRNWPYQQNPREASVECAYEAVLHGADYLNSFIHVTFGTGSDARPERWAFTGRELRKISNLGPLLARTARPQAPVALLYPTAQTCIKNEPCPKAYAYACLSSGFGDTDVLTEDVALEQPRLTYQTIVLLGCEILHRGMALKLEGFVRGGGTLVLDRVPTKDHHGEPLVAGAGLFQDGPLGKGRVAVLPVDFEEAYRTAIEGPNPAEARRLRGLLTQGVRATPHVVATDAPAQLEAGLRTAADVALLIVVNHDAQANTGQVKLAGLPFAPRRACDAVTGKPYPLQVAGKGGRLSVKLPARQAVIIKLLP